MLSKKRTIRVRCADCGKMWEIDVWIALEEQEDADTVQMLEDGLFFKRFCPQCGKEYEYVTPTVYFDKKSKVMICFVKGSVEISQTELFITDLLKEIRVDRDSIKLRITTSCNEFIEKVLLHRNNIDDRVVELIKLWALDIVREEGYTQQFDETRCSVNEQTQELQVDFCGAKPRHLCLDMNMYERFAKDALKILNKEPTPLEVNADWAIDFAIKHNM